VTGQITMSIDCHELGIFAGATSALGLVASPAVIDATKARVRAWASTKEGRVATWHAAHFLKDTLENNKGELHSSLSHSRAVVIAFLTVYAFAVASESTFSATLTSRSFTDCFSVGWFRSERQARAVRRAV
jgi:hypothetical protein